MAKKNSQQDKELNPERLPSSSKNGRSRGRPDEQDDSALGDYYPVDYFGDSGDRGEELRDNVRSPKGTKR